jgi:hypothetical protein
MAIRLKSGQDAMPITACDSFAAELRWRFHTVQATIQRKQPVSLLESFVVNQVFNSTTTTTIIVTVPALNPTIPFSVPNKKRDAVMATLTTIAHELMKKDASTPTFVSKCTSSSALSSACSCLLGESAPVILEMTPSPTLANGLPGGNVYHNVNLDSPNPSAMQLKRRLRPKFQRPCLYLPT